MSRLRHVYIYAMQVTSKVRNAWYGTTSTVEKLIVPEISQYFRKHLELLPRNIWNYFLMHSGMMIMMWKKRARMNLTSVKWRRTKLSQNWQTYRALSHKFEKMWTIVTAPTDTVTTPGLKTKGGSIQKRGGGHVHPISEGRDRPNRRHRQILLHLMLISMLLSALHTLCLTPLIFRMRFRGMISHVVMMSKRAKVNAKLSAYDPDLMSLDACKKLNNWENSKQSNSWKQAIMNDIDNLKFDLFKIIPL